MLQQLRIRHLAVVEDLSIQFGPGLNLLTGETGAGKSIIVGSLHLLLGGRAGGDRVRAGGDAALVEATFRLSRADRARLQSAGAIPPGGDAPTVVAARWIDTAGRSRSALNGQGVPLTRLRSTVANLVAVHGQHSQQSLLLPGIYRKLLDRFAGMDGELEELQARYGRMRSGERELGRLRGDPESLQARRELLQFQIAEIRDAGPRPGEEEELRRDREVLRNAARILQACQEIEGNLDSQEGAAAGLHRLNSGLEVLAEADPRFSDYRDRTRELTYLLQELSREIADFRDGADWRPDRLDEVEARLSRLHSLKSRYGGGLTAVLDFLKAAEEEVGRLEDVEKTARDLEESLRKHRVAFQELAAEVSRRRRESARRLEELLGGQLRELAFPRGTRFRVRVRAEPNPESPVLADGEPVEFDAGGWDRVEFRIAPNPGEPLRDLARISSGGELSRILLGLQSLCEGERSPGGTMVFDEVDSGIGAEVAAVVGDRLRRLGHGHQVICVTHWPQIAAGAQSHFRVRKRFTGGRTRVEVNRLSGEDRKREIARMLGGRVAPSASLHHAAELLKTLSPRSGVR